MGYKYYSRPKIQNAQMIAAWPGIGNVGLLAVDTLRSLLEAEMFAEIEPWEFFYPRSLTIQKGELKNLQFPTCKFYYKEVSGKQLIIFVGEQQPSQDRKSYEMAELVLNMAQKFGCTKIYTSAAAVTPIHHTVRPMVWAVPNSKALIAEVQTLPNTILMSDLEERAGEGNITGLNGFLLGLARKKGIDGICLLGEMPTYIAELTTPYPKASKSILEVLAGILEIELNLSILDEMAREVEENMERIYDMIPSEVRERIDRLKQGNNVRRGGGGSITEGDKRRIMQGIEEFFGKGSKED